MVEAFIDLAGLEVLCGCARGKELLFIDEKSRCDGDRKHAQGYTHTHTQIHRYLTGFPSSTCAYYKNVRKGKI